MMTLAKPRCSTAITTGPVRVSFVIDALSRAGTETQLLALLRSLDRNVVEPTLVLLDGASEESQALEPPGVPTLRLGVTKLVSLSSVRAAFRLRQFWQEHMPDVVQAYFLDSAYFSLPVAKSCGIRTRVRVRNNLGYWLTRKHRLLERLLRPLVSATLTNSETGRDALKAQGARRVHVIGNGVDLDRFRITNRDRPEAGAVLVGCVANLRAVKNIDGLLRAAAVVCRERPDVMFTVAGDGPERAKLEALRDELSLRGRFHFAGSLSDIPAYLSTLTFAVLPSHSEGMSNALLEAMAAGRAVVATDVGASARVLGDAGVIVPPGDTAALAQAILRLCDNPQLTQRLGRRARARVEVEFSRDAMRQQFEAFYPSLITGYRKLQPAALIPANSVAG